MGDILGTELEELRRIANRLIDFVDNLSGEKVVVPPEVEAEVNRKLRKRICLACDSEIPPEVKVKRGQEEACYNTTRSRIRKGDVRERDLIISGKLTAENLLPGRKAKQDLTSEEKRLRVAEDLAAYRAKTAARKAKNDGKD
jgi:hypothetical protein